MKQKTDKKLISFTKLPLIDRLVKDEAEKENRSESAIIEIHLLKSFLPEEKNARFWTENFLYSENGGIGRTLEAIFATNAAGVNWGSKYDNLLPLVEFAKTQESLCNTVPTGEEIELHHCCSQLDSIVTKLEHLTDEETDTAEKYAYQKEAKWAKDLLTQLREEPQYSRYVNIYQLLINNWEDLKGWSITYRLLADLVVLEKGWRNTAETRTELLNILKIVSAEWND
ncbi:hypothetical protein OD350_29440 (plasmid) [Clostridium beijerinckii]|uniref:hypothetical protein n=1 Tax=Clostridium beijerinckii TaxID=1520 RepID=UPI002227CD2F|nr:hypothetical protein [Clostridium beijerinckii]UYZ39014.1 hypothetical protein OD350_29440 [Clostridium beijerinckii]